MSQKLVEAAAAYAKTQRFSRVCIPSDMLGFYEKYGFVRIDELVNYGGDTDHIFARDIQQCPYAGLPPSGAGQTIKQSAA